MQHGNSPGPRSLLPKVQNRPPKSHEIDWHRTIAASTAMSVTGVVPWSLSRPAIWSYQRAGASTPATRNSSCRGDNRLEWGRWDPRRSIRKSSPPRINIPTEIASCMCHLCYYVDWCSLFAYLPHWPLCLQKEQWWIIIIQSQNIITKQSATTVLFWPLTIGTFASASFHMFFHHAWSTPCVVQSKALIWRLTPLSHALQNDCPFCLKYIGLNSKIQRLIIMYGVWKCYKLRGCNGFAFQLPCYSLHCTATLLLGPLNPKVPPTILTALIKPVLESFTFN